MKKTQRSFAIEYKSGRRKAERKTSSIWGDMDLKSVAKDVQQDAIPFLPGSENDDASGKGVSPLQAEQAEPLLTAPIAQHTTVSLRQETNMADENDTITDTNAPASVVAALDAPKKQRKPRTKKAAPETASLTVASEPADVSATPAGKRGKQTRGRKPKSSVAENKTESAPLKRGRKAVRTAAAAPISASDEMADLLQLEEENQRLRKLLAEKLRLENADLRKKLNLG